MAVRCKHPRASRALVTRRAGNGLHATHNVCPWCGTWLSLGPANDEPAAVKLEIRAAELAVVLATLDGILDWQFAPNEWDDERRGWSMAETNMQQHTDAWQSGYLARCIATHDDTQGGAP